MTLPGNKEPLVKKFAELAGMWTLAMLGYFALFPNIGFELDYSTNAIPFTLYFLAWSAFCIYFFWPTFRKSDVLNINIKTEGVMSLGLAGIIWALLYWYAQLPLLSGPVFSPYTDMILGTPWYFAPKMADILMQQILVAVLVLEINERVRSLTSVILWYAFFFGGSHVFLYAATTAPFQHAALMTGTAFLSSLFFPALLLRVRGGFIYSYALHVLFYIAIALILHTWPPPGYGF